MRVRAICNAYESGVGHGVKADQCINPHPKGSEEYEAYDIGYEEGYERLGELDDGPFNGLEN